jgi:CheY-like chemotaxis protein
MHSPPIALLVDRDADTRQMYREYLRLGDWTVEESADGREALAKAINIHPDIVVTETRLSGMSGYDLCALLRRDSATRSIPIVVVTGNAYEKDMERARAAGADMVLAKPCLPEMLMTAVRELYARTWRPCESSSSFPGAPPVGRSERRTGSPNDLRQRMLSHTHVRHDTTTPPIAPPSLVCPKCDRALIYRRSHIGGVSARHPEQWDYFECPNSCGTFQYRERTHKLRQVS